MTSLPAARPSFRYDIEGLRAVAALLVAVYHIWLGRVSGGVDVFFVIAGFLITGTLLRQIRSTGRISPGRFIGNLLVRLLPNALTVLTVVLIATLTLLPPSRRDGTLREIAASALYVENWALIASAVDYAARDRADSPVQHFWAMSIQGQFYLIWLALAVIALLLGARRMTHRRLFVIILALTLSSFAYSVAYTLRDQPVAYFHTGARVWEFGVGGLLALSLHRLPMTGIRTERIAGWAGLLLIVITGVILPVGSAFPGLAALLPVTGAILILSTGRNLPGTAGAFLSNRVFVSLGQVAYALYLWHWPILVFALTLLGIDSAGPVLGTAVLAASVLLAYLTTTFVETPVRKLNWKRAHPWLAPAMGTTFAVAVAIASVSSITLMGTGPASSTEVSARWAMDGSPPRFDVPATGPFLPSLVESRDDVPQSVADGCQQSMRGPSVKECLYGDLDASRTMLLIGGSHAAHWEPALSKIAEEHGWVLKTMYKGGCRQGMHLVGEEYGLYGNAEIDASCREWSRTASDLIAEDPPDLVISNTTVIGPDGKEEFPPYYSAFWEELDGMGIPSVGIRGTTRAPFDRLECIQENGAASNACEVPREEVLPTTNPAEDLQDRFPGLVSVDLSDWLCSETHCPAIIENMVVYRDAHHLTATFSRSLAVPLFNMAPEVFS